MWQFQVKYRKHGGETSQEFDGEIVGSRQKRSTINDASWAQQWQLVKLLSLNLPKVVSYESITLILVCYYWYIFLYQKLERI